MIKLGLKEMVSAAKEAVPSRSPQEVVDLLEKGELLMVDVREAQELQKAGKIPGALHASRGMLELHVDPDSPAFKKEFGEETEFLFY